MSTVNIIISASYEKKAMKTICVIMEKVMRIISVTKVKKSTLEGNYTQYSNMKNVNRGNIIN